MLTTTTTTAPRIYVACLAAYNSGRLHGRWIDLEGKDTQDVFEAINDMLAASPEPNVIRRKCPNCGHYQTDSGFDKPEPLCGSCEHDISGVAFKPSAEEWAVHAHDGFCGLIKGEWPDIAELVAFAQFVENASESERIGFAYLIDDLNMSVQDAAERADEVCLFDGSAREYAEELLEECYGREIAALPELIRYHIDAEGIARDLMQAGDLVRFDHDGTSYLITNASAF